MLSIPKDRLPELLAATKALTENDLLVGIPEENNARPDGAITNSALGYIHETGSPGSNIPARPWLEPGVRSSTDNIVSALKVGATDAMNGDRQGAMKGLAVAGVIAVNAVVAYVLAGIPPPLASRTVAARRQRSKGSTYRRKATTATDVTPLWDTGEMVGRATTWVIRRRGA
jgi:hypothetical protein